MLKILCLFMSTSLSIANTYAALSGQEIISKNEEAQRVEGIRSDAVLTLGAGTISDRVKKFTWWRKLTSDHVHFNTMTRFHQPAEVRGEGILFLEHEGDTHEVLLYLPNFKKIRRVENQQQSGSFMGSELSYSDINSIHVNDYHHKLLNTEPCPTGDGGNSNQKCYKVESTPASDAVKDRTGYSKTVNWVRDDNFMGVKTEFYNTEGEHLKDLNSSRIEMIDPVNKKWMALRVRVDNLKNKKFTLLEFSQVKVNSKIPDSTFTQQNLARP